MKKSSSSKRKRSSKSGKSRKSSSKTHPPLPNHIIKPPVYAASDVDTAIHALVHGTHEAIIVDAELQLPFDGATMVRYFNARCKPEYAVPVPTSSHDLSMKTYNLPGIAGGMWHAYATRAHDAALDSPVVNRIFTEMTGTPHWQARPNRFRFNPVNMDDGWKQAHLEGEHVMRDTSDIGCIVCESVGRSFTYYEKSNNCNRARSLYEELGGPNSKFVRLSQQQLRHWRRVTIQTTKPGQIILFAGSVIHEISRLNRSLSLFLSPFNPNIAVDSAMYYSNCTRNQARVRQKADVAAPLLPPCLLTDGQKRQHPKEYASMTRRETEIFGSLFHSAGCYWPSGKPTFFLFHMMAFNAFQHKMQPFMFDANGKFNYEIITPELVAASKDFDGSYFEQLPLIHVTAEEVLEMRTKYTGIPESAWPLVQYWTKDPRECSDSVAYRRGYLHRKDDL
jgi:hypothetical protein